MFTQLLAKFLAQFLTQCRTCAGHVYLSRGEKFSKLPLTTTLGCVGVTLDARAARLFISGRTDERTRPDARDASRPYARDASRPDAFGRKRTRPDASGRVRLGASDSIHGAVVQRVRTTRTESPGGAKAHTQTRAVVETHTHYSILCVRTRAGLAHGGANCKGYTKTGGLAL